VRTMIDSGLVIREANGNGGGYTGGDYTGTHWRVVKNIEDIEIPGNLQTRSTARSPSCRMNSTGNCSPSNGRN
jgi:hypothetical protein